MDAFRYGPWAVIAGGSEGVGACFAHRLATSGINLILIARKPAPLRETADRARRFGVDVRTLSQDLTAPGAMDAIRSVTDGVDVGLLIFNAGANTYHGALAGADLSALQRVLDLNVRAQMLLASHFGARLQMRGHGGLMLVGSTAGYTGHPTIGAYAAAKAFSRILAESLWLELKPQGVDVLGLVLGVTRTPAMERTGLNMASPEFNVSEPDDVAREGLEHLTDGPVWVAGDNLPLAIARSGFPRDQVLRTATEATNRLFANE